MEAKLSSEAEMIYKKLGHQRYKSLVEDMRKIAEKFKERHNRYENIVKEPLTPSTGVKTAIQLYLFRIFFLQSRNSISIL